ncbi:MAG: protein kinase domain-containing protein, partial [Burkholderiales bacterium]
MLVPQPAGSADPIAALNAALADRYVIDHELGQGGMAVVYLARDLRHERFVALKTLRPDVAVAVGQERFLREIRLAARLQHPNILAVYDSGEAAGALYYVMPYVEGESLRNRLDREPQLPLEEALQIAREVADALSYAHDHDVVHRDIKPENIMLTGSAGGHAIVADFGIARAISAAGTDKLTKTGLAIGTAAYMSPEQAAGTGQVDRRSDIYSLACVLYEMLAGQPPFTGPTVQAILARHSLDSVPRLKIVREMIPDQLERVINRALAKAPADRYQTAAQFAEALAAASTGRISRVTARRPFGSGGFPWRMRTPVVVATILPLFAVLAVGVWILLGGNGEDGTGGTRAGRLDPARVAVLYFQDLSPDSSLRYLAAGLTHGLIDELSRVGQIEVLSRNAVASFRGAPPSRDSIARALTAGSLVEGTVDAQGEQVRINVRLVDGTSGVDLERTSIVLPAREPLAMRDSVVAEVATLLRRSLGEEVELRQRRAGTENTDAWTLVQRGDWLRSEAQRAYRGSDRRGAVALAQQA